MPQQATTMEIRSFSLDCGLTVAEVDSGTDRAWHFLPFEHCRADLHPLDDRYLVAVGQAGPSQSVAIFDRVERRRTNAETNDRMLPGSALTGNNWCYAPAHRSIFVPETLKNRSDLKKLEDHTGNCAQFVRQLSVDGEVNRQLLIAPGFSARQIIPRNDDLLVCIGLNRVAVLDPTSGEVRISETDLIRRTHHTRHNKLQWFSPDGRWALRPHLGSIIRSGGAHTVKSSLLRLTGVVLKIRQAVRTTDVTADENLVPPNDGAQRFGVALDLFRLDPIGFERRLIVGYFTADELFGQPSIMLRGPYPATVARQTRVLNDLADRQNFRTWNGRDQLLLTRNSHLKYDTGEESVSKQLLNEIRNIVWEPDNHSFTVALAQGVRIVPSVWHSVREEVTDTIERQVSLSGAIGPSRFVTGEPKQPPEMRMPSKTAIESIQAYIRQQSEASSST